MQALAKVGARPLGTVLNKVKPQRLGRYGGYYYRYYHYGYRYGANGSAGSNGTTGTYSPNGAARKGKLFGLLGTHAANGTTNGVHHGPAHTIAVPAIPDQPAQN